MKDAIINKLTIIIEAANYKSISNEVMKTVHAFEKSIAPNPELRLSLVENDTKKSESLSPENWDYWAV